MWLNIVFVALQIVLKLFGVVLPSGHPVAAAVGKVHDEISKARDTGDTSDVEHFD